MAGETVKRKYVLEFRILNVAQKDTGKILKALKPALGSIGMLVGKLAVVGAMGFKKFGVAGVAAGLAIYGAFSVITAAFGLLKQGLRALVGLVQQAIQVGVVWQNSITLVSVAGKTARDIFEELSLRVADIGVGAREAAKGFEVLVRAGLSGKQAVEVFTDLALFSRAIGVSMRKTSTLLVGAMAAFRKKASEAADVLKVFSFAILRTRFNFETFSTAFAFGGAAAAGFNQDLTETVAIMTKFFDMGLRASTVGTTMRNMLTRLAKPTREARIALAQYGIAIEQVTPANNKLKDILITLIPLQKDLAAMTTLFGRRTAGFIANLLKELTKNGEAIEEVMKKIADSAGLVEEAMIKRLGTTAGQLERFIAQWENFKVEIFRAIEPVVKDLLVDFNDGIIELRKNFADAAPFITNILFSIKSLFELIVGAPLRTVFDMLAPLFGDITGGITNFQEAAGKSDTTIGKLSSGFKSLSIFTARSAIAMRYLLREARAFGAAGLIKIFNFTTDSALRLKDAIDDDDGLGKDAVNLAAIAAGLPKIFEKGFSDTTIKKIREEAQRTVDAMNKAGAEIPKIPEKATVAFLKLTKVTGTLLTDLKAAIEDEGLGAFVKRINDIRTKFGPEIAKMFGDAAKIFAAGKPVTAMMDAIRETMGKQKGLLGVFFGLGPADRNRIIRSTLKLGTEVIEKVGKTLATKPSVVVDALIGSRRVTSKQKTAITDLVNRTFKSFFADIEKQRGELPEEFVVFDIPKFRAALEKIVPGVDTLFSSFNKMDTATKQVMETWSKFNTDVAIKMSDNLKEMEKSLSTTAWLEFARNTKLAGVEAVKAQAQIEKLSGTFKDRFNKELLNAVDTLKKTPDKLRLVTKEIGENAKIVGEVEAAWKSLDLELRTEVLNTFRELGIKMSGPELRQYAQEVIEAANAEKIWKKAMSERQAEINKYAAGFQDLLELRFGTLKAELMTDDEIRELAKHHAAIKRMNKQKRLFEQKAAEQAAAANEILYSWTEMQRRQFTVFGGFMKKVGSDIGRALVDGTFDLRKSLRSAVKDMIAQLITLAIQATVVKSIFKGIFGPGRGKTLFGKVFGFGFQHGTGLGGVPGPTGIDRIPAMVTKGEIILDRSASDLLRQVVASGGTGGTNMTFNINAMDGASVERVVRTRITPLFKSQLRNNTGISPEVAIRSNRANRRRPR